MKEIAALAKALSEEALSLAWGKETPVHENSGLGGLPLETGDTGDGLLQLSMRKELKVSPVNEADRGQPGTKLGTPSTQARPPGFERRPRQRSGNGLHNIIVDGATTDSGQRAHHDELLARADVMIAEVEGRRPPSNQSVRAMFTEARARLGSRDLEERSITAWLRRHAPEIAACWPEAPLTAAWFDWRSRVPPQNTSVLDQAFREVSRGSGSSHE